MLVLLDNRRRILEWCRRTLVRLGRSVRYESNPRKDPQFIGLFAIF